MMKIIRKIGFAASVLILVSPAALVFFWMLSLSFKNELDNTAYPPVFLPSTFNFNNYAQVFETTDFFGFLLNSIIVTGGAVLIGLIVGVPAAYGIARLKSSRLAILFLIARMTPAMSFLIPLFLIFQFVGLLGSLWALVITHLVITVPIIVWVMIGAFENISTDLEDASAIDGCSAWGRFWHIALPLARSGMGISTILAFIFSWNNFIFAVVLGSKTTRTLPAAVYNVISFEEVSWGPLAAAALLVTAPVLIVTLLAQKQIVSGLSAGGLKD